MWSGKSVSLPKQFPLPDLMDNFAFEFETPNFQCLSAICHFVESVEVTSGGSTGCNGRSPRAKLFHFHAGFWKKWSNSRLLCPLGVGKCKCNGKGCTHVSFFISTGYIQTVLMTQENIQFLCPCFGT